LGGKLRNTGVRLGQLRYRKGPGMAFGTLIGARLHFSCSAHYTLPLCDQLGPASVILAGT
jgi:hypothetical protein